MHLPSSLLLQARRLSTQGMGTNRLRWMAPAAFSAVPFSLPDARLQEANPKPQRAANPSKASTALTRPPARLLTPVALPSARRGATPQNSNTALRPSRTHSDVSPRKRRAGDAFEKGSVATRQCASVTAAPSSLRGALGEDGARRAFGAVPTDNGSELANEGAIAELIGEREIETRLFCCDPGQSRQRGACEKNRVEIRKLLPEGAGARFEGLTAADCALTMSQVNSGPRGALGFLTPRECCGWPSGRIPPPSWMRSDGGAGARQAGPHAPLHRQGRGREERGGRWRDSRRAWTWAGGPIALSPERLRGGWRSIRQRHGNTGLHSLSTCRNAGHGWVVALRLKIYHGHKPSSRSTSVRHVQLEHGARHCGHLNKVE